MSTASNTYSQKKVLALIANHPKPDHETAEHLHDLADSLGLPPRITVRIEDYTKKALETAAIKQRAKEVEKKATELWDAIREESTRDDDLVDLAFSSMGDSDAEALAPAAQQPDEPEEEETPRDEMLAFLGSRDPKSLDLFAEEWDKKELIDYLENLPMYSGDPNQVTIVTLTEAAIDLVSYELHEPVRDLVAQVVCEFFECIRSGESDAQELFNQIEEESSIDPEEFIVRVYPDVAKELAKNNDDENRAAALSFPTLRLIRDFFAFWPGALDCGLYKKTFVDAVASEIQTQLNDSKPKPSLEETEAKKKQAKKKREAEVVELTGAKKKEADEAFEKGRECFIQGNDKNPFRKGHQRRAWVAGWDESKAAYDKEKAELDDEEHAVDDHLGTEA